LRHLPSPLASMLAVVALHCLCNFAANAVNAKWRLAFGEMNMLCRQMPLMPKSVRHFLKLSGFFVYCIGAAPPVNFRDKFGRNNRRVRHWRCTAGAGLQASAARDSQHLPSPLSSTRAAVGLHCLCSFAANAEWCSAIAEVNVIWCMGAAVQVTVCVQMPFKTRGIPSNALASTCTALVL
jgi:hypothetical protein